VTKRRVIRLGVTLAIGVIAYLVTAIYQSSGQSAFIAVLIAAWTWVLVGLIGRRLTRSARPQVPYAASPPRPRSAPPPPPVEPGRPRSKVDSINPFGPRR
jgi:hypothetical protein